MNQVILVFQHKSLFNINNQLQHNVIVKVDIKNPAYIERIDKKKTKCFVLNTNNYYARITYPKNPEKEPTLVRGNEFAEIPQDALAFEIERNIT